MWTIRRSPEISSSAIRNYTRVRVTRQYTTIILHIAADKTKEFEAMFEGEELKRWDDYTRRGRFVEARLIRCHHSDFQSEGIQDYVLHVVTADEEAHHEHDEDPDFKAFDERAEAFQPKEPSVTFGELVFERKST